MWNLYEILHKISFYSYELIRWMGELGLYAQERQGRLGIVIGHSASICISERLLLCLKMLLHFLNPNREGM